ncbi:MAG: hypothetical protein AB1646_23425 [Thermodesulfobacteriota bacterium]
MTPYLTTTHGALFNGDYLEIMASMRSEVVDCVFADPPFNLGKDYGDVVLYPFGGGRSTFQAAEPSHRNWIGIGLYDCAYIQARLKERFPLSIGRNPKFDFRRLFGGDEDHGHQILRRGQG